MEIGKLIRNARKAKGWNLEDLALKAGTDTGNLSRFERGLQGASQELLTRLLEELGLSITEAEKNTGIAISSQPGPPLDSDYSLVPVYSATGDCGNGYHNDHIEINGSLAFNTVWLAKRGVKPEHAAVIYASGSSMEPYIFDGDAVLFDTSDVEPRHRHVYVVRRPDCSLSIKRLVLQLSGDWIVKSDNPDYEDERVSAETIHDVPLVGRVRWRGGNMD